MRHLAFALDLLLAAWALANEPGLPLREDSFNKNQLLRSSSLQLANPAGFSMQQSYSVQFTGSSVGTHSSGMYLNTLTYQFGIPLTLSLDVGLYNMFYASAQNQAQQKFSQTKPEVLFPRLSLEYRPSENTLLSVQFLRTNDAVKAYGISPYGSWFDFR